ncbi:MAG TPA: thiamine pyrophosphate-dependent enzyme, partial [Burkholderiaceae bacterium]|nr:thiamine pyrophosphate-dependent enzyme [Burkholderiaceae bacterium]
GGGHVPHAARRNVDITYLLFDNGIYGLTKGQTSPTSAVGFRTSTSPYENFDQPLNPLMMVLSYGATWVGQAYAGRPQQLEELIKQAIAHRGFSYLHILSPCVTFDKTDKTYQQLGAHVVDVPQGHDIGDLGAAIALAANTDRPALGLIYQCTRPTLADALDAVAAKAGYKAAGVRRRAAA